MAWAKGALRHSIAQRCSFVGCKRHDDVQVVSMADYCTLRRYITNITRKLCRLASVSTSTSIPNLPQYIDIIDRQTPRRLIRAEDRDPINDLVTHAVLVLQQKPSYTRQVGSTHDLSSSQRFSTLHTPGKYLLPRKHLLHLFLPSMPRLTASGSTV